MSCTQENKCVHADDIVLSCAQDIARFQSQLKDPSTGEGLKEELQGQILEWRRYIQEHEEHIDRLDEKLAAATATLDNLLG